MDESDQVFDKWVNLTPGTLGTILLYWLRFRIIIDITICSIQFYTDLRNAEIPAVFQAEGITQERFLSSRSYRINKIGAKILGYVYMYCVVHFIYIGMSSLWMTWAWSGTIYLRLGLSEDIDPEYGWTAIFIVVATTWFHAFDIPMRLLDFLVEQYHGFSQSFLSFCYSELKIYWVEFSVTMLLGMLLVILVKETAYFYIPLAGVSVFLLFSYLYIYPEWISPFLSKFHRLPIGSLRNRLIELVGRCEYPLYDVVVELESTKTAHAFVYCDQSRRIILSDTLLRTYLRNNLEEGALIHPHLRSRAALQAINDDAEGDGCTEDEIVALAAHEIGHWKANHLTYRVGLSCFDLTVLYIVFTMYYQSSILYEAFSIPEESNKPIILGFFIIFSHILDTVHFVLDLIIRAITRYCELKADNFAVSLDQGVALRSALIKTSVAELEVGEFHPLYVWFYMSVPPLDIRLREIQEEMRKRQ